MLFKDAWHKSSVPVLKVFLSFLVGEFSSNTSYPGLTPWLT